jgi:hypothetical protein
MHPTLSQIIRIAAQAMICSSAIAVLLAPIGKFLAKYLSVLRRIDPYTDLMTPNIQDRYDDIGTNPDRLFDVASEN